MGLAILFMGSAAVVAAAWTWTTYNRLIQRRNRVENAFASVDVAARKRYDLVPNLVACVKGYAAHEQHVMEQATQLRQLALKGHLSQAASLVASDEMTRLTGRLMAISEAHPDLKASDQFLHLQRTLTELEEQLSAARRFFNTAVTQYNTMLQTMPTPLIASRLGFDEREWFQIGEVERAAIRVELLSSDEAVDSAAGEP
jgi:LemA protein